MKTSKEVTAVIIFIVFSFAFTLGIICLDIGYYFRALVCLFASLICVRNMYLVVKSESPETKG